MLATSTIYWDERLIHQNGEVGQTFETETPGIIKVLTRIPEQGLTKGKHLLSAEISTFHVGHELETIGYLLDIVDEQYIHSSILFLSVISAIFIGISLILTIIFQLIYWLYQKEISYQIFSLFCLVSSLILVSEQAKFWLDYTYNGHVVRLSFIYSFTFIASFLLPLFYLFNYKIKNKKLVSGFILLSLLGLSFTKSGYDHISTMLFYGALLWALTLNLYRVFYKHSGLIHVLIIFISLLFLFFIPEYFNEFGFSLVFIFIVIAILVSLINEMHLNKNKALKAERMNAELLRRNMQPHFLMNCLTQLIELVEVMPKKAVEFIVILSDEFRQLSQQNDKNLVPLSDELALCNKHLAIMSFRYQQKYCLDISGEIRGINIPPSILHSQIENCFTHNKISSSRPFELEISKQNDRVYLLLRTPIEKNIDHKGTGLGERYIKAKLAEVDQSQNHKAAKSTFNSCEKNNYWVSQYEFNS